MSIDTPFYIAGILLALFAGYSEYTWIFIILSASIMVFGFLLLKMNTGTIEVMLSRGIPTFLLLFIFQILIYSIPTAIAYFVASLFS